MAPVGNGNCSALGQGPKDEGARCAPSAQHHHVPALQRGAALGCRFCAIACMRLGVKLWVQSW